MNKKNFKILVKDVKSFVRNEVKLYASNSNKRFYIKLHAGPNVKRYGVENRLSNKTTWFNKVGDAVRFFNSI